MGSFPGFAIGVQQEEQARARRQELADEKRKTTLKTLLEDAETPQDKVAAIEAVYHQDPSVLRQHVENLTRKLTGKGSQPVVSPAEAQAGRLAPIAARGKTPAQQNLDAYKAQLDAQLGAQAQTDQGREAAMRKIISDPNLSQDDKQSLLSVYGAPAPRRATSDEMKRQDYQTLLASGQIPKDSQGNPLSYEAWVANQSASGRVSGSPEKPPQGKTAGTSKGQNVFGFPTKNGWVDVTGQPITDFRPLPNYAQVAPSLRAVQVVNPSDPTSTVYESIPQAIKSGAQGTQSIGYKMQMPTGTERARADLAISAREQLGTMESILQNRADLFGPVAGRELNFQEWIGSQDPDAQRFKAAARIAADHLAGVFGGRSQAALEAIYQTIGNNATNPASGGCRIGADEHCCGAYSGAGSAPAPKAAQPKVGDTKTFPNGKKGIWDGQGWVAQ